MTPSSLVISARAGQSSSNGTTRAATTPSSSSLRSILSRTPRTPKATGIRVRFNIKAYVIDALEGGDWRAGSPKVDKQLAREIMWEDHLVLYPTMEDWHEVRRLVETRMANATSWKLSEDGVMEEEEEMTVYVERCGLRFVDGGERQSPVRENLPGDMQVREEQLRRTGVTLARTTSVYLDISASIKDSSRASFVSLTDNLEHMMSKLSINDVPFDLPALVPTTANDDVVETTLGSANGPLTPPDEKGSFSDGMYIPREAAKPPRSPLARQKSGKGKARKNLSAKITPTTGSTSYSEWQMPSSPTGLSILDGF
ncbi:hypothetical protein BDY19DRAFT_998557 [Irpex rosettiformis]|uniref:Uncharacterized protein n=1 Tax=Irpex rosettiformis TaxID=378272 RepID=A0ACB8TN64_9APHY|nr:hypothetical protein BDY19DRAFT_998557 [Irpex rosettiformis]